MAALVEWALAASSQWVVVAVGADLVSVEVVVVEAVEMGILHSLRKLWDCTQAAVVAKPEAEVRGVDP